jgi:plasmid stability protein
MVSITLKDIPEALHRTLKQRARLHHRSLNKEVLATIEGALHGAIGQQEIRLGTGLQFTTRRPADNSLIKMDFGNDWEMNK